MFRKIRSSQSLVQLCIINVTRNVNIELILHVVYKLLFLWNIFYVKLIQIVYLFIINLIIINTNYHFKLCSVILSNFFFTKKKYLSWYVYPRSKNRVWQRWKLTIFPHISWEISHPLHALVFRPPFVEMKNRMGPILLCNGMLT